MSSMVPRPPKGYGKHVLYLDFDGVLHHENCLWPPRKGACPPVLTELKSKLASHFTFDLRSAP